MIAKGAARSGPRQLAVYLMRVEDYATGEPATLLELQSAWAAAPNGTPERTAAKLIEAFRDWQALAEGTKQGRDGLYHAEISPAPQYTDTMTPEQWKRAADILGEELGLQNQPRAMVLHGGTDGRKHLHVVWARTDIDTMKIVSDGYNYVANERASKRMELEFGHELVPGKHAKRDRERQPEFPRQEFDFADAQMTERSGMTVAERKEEIKNLQAASANGEEFKKALEEAGYVLARGERGYIVVDQDGVHSTLSRNLRGVMDKAQVEKFMAGVALDQLPTIEEAQTLQAERAKQAREAERASLPPEMTTAERREQITGIRKSCDDAQAFKHALEEAGYLLAQGNRGGYVVVDEQGKAFSVFTHLADIKRKEYKAFMAPVELASLPDIEQARAIQHERAAKTHEQGVEASKFVALEILEKHEEPGKTAIDFSRYAKFPIADRPSEFQPQPEAREPTPAPPPAELPSKFVPPAKKEWDFGKYANYPITPKSPAAPQPPAEQPSKFLPQPVEAKAPAPVQPPAPKPQPEPEIEDPTITKLKKTLEEYYAKEYQKWRDLYAFEYGRKDFELKNQNATKLEDYDLKQADQFQALLDKLNDKKKGIWGYIDAVDSKLNPSAAIEKALLRQQEINKLKARQQQERKDYIILLEQTRQIELEGLREKQQSEQKVRELKDRKETDQLISERKAALRLRAEIEAEEKQKAHEPEKGEDWDDWPPPPKMGK